MNTSQVHHVKGQLDTMLGYQRIPSDELLDRNRAGIGSSF
jgi:hypothetical protein